jgi:hypothetical protein
MVPAADAKASQEAMTETFLLSNIAPQVGEGFNRHCERISCVAERVALTSPSQTGPTWSRCVFLRKLPSSTLELTLTQPLCPSFAGA